MLKAVSKPISSLLDFVIVDGSNQVLVCCTPDNAL